jgi:hypothetical protein
LPSNTTKKHWAFESLIDVLFQNYNWNCVIPHRTYIMVLNSQYLHKVKASNYQLNTCIKYGIVECCGCCENHLWYNCNNNKNVLIGSNNNLWK